MVSACKLCGRPFLVDSVVDVASWMSSGFMKGNGSAVVLDDLDNDNYRLYTISYTHPIAVLDIVGYDAAVAQFELEVQKESKP